MQIRSGVYLIHFDTPFKHAQHYIGFSFYVRERVEHNLNGTGANLPRHVRNAGINMQLVRVWWGEDRNFERKLKNRKNSPAKLCPICRAKKNPKNYHPLWKGLECSLSQPTKEQSESIPTISPMLNTIRADDRQRNLIAS